MPTNTVRRAGSKIAKGAQKAIKNVRGAKSELIRKLVGQNKSASQIITNLEKKGFSVYPSEVYRIVNS